MWYVGKPTHDWRVAGRRDLGDYINDHVLGKLAELGFAQMLQEHYGITAKIDLEVHPGAQAINETDIKSVSIGAERRPPRIKIDVKATTPGSKYFLVDAREFRNRRYDAYVLVLVDLPGDHLFRFLANKLELPDDLRRFVKPLESISVEVAGFAYREDIEKYGRLYGAGTWLTDPDNPKKKLVQLKVGNFGLPIRNLRRRKEDWDDLVSKL